MSSLAFLHVLLGVPLAPSLLLLPLLHAEYRVSSRRCALSHTAPSLLPFPSRSFKKKTLFFFWYLLSCQDSFSISFYPEDASTSCWDKQKSCPWSESRAETESLFSQQRQEFPFLFDYKGLIVLLLVKTGVHVSWSLKSLPWNPAVALSTWHNLWEQKQSSGSW